MSVSSDGTAPFAAVTRGEVVESLHRGWVAVVDRAGNLVASADEIDRVVYFRSSAKPFQAVPLVESGTAAAFAFSERDLALACSSHDSTPDHQRGVARMLEKSGLHEEDLRCGISPIADEREQTRSVLGLVWPSQVQCECSGEHAGRLAAGKHLGYPLDTYVDQDHPLQRRILEIMATVLVIDAVAITLGTDGCSIPTFAAPLRRFALAYAILGTPCEGTPAIPASLAAALDRLRRAMLAHPVMVDNTGVLDTDIIRVSNGRIVAKLGAEGLLCLAVPDQEIGIALATESGLPRGRVPAVIAILQQMGLADEAMARARGTPRGRGHDFQGRASWRARTSAHAVVSLTP